MSRAPDDATDIENVEFFRDEMNAFGLGAGEINPLRQQLVGVIALAIAIAVVAGLTAARETFLKSDSNVAQGAGAVTIIAGKP